MGSPEHALLENVLKNMQREESETQIYEVKKKREIVLCYSAHNIGHYAPKFTQNKGTYSPVTLATGTIGIPKVLH